MARAPRRPERALPCATAQRTPRSRWQRARRRPLWKEAQCPLRRVQPRADRPAPARGVACTCGAQSSCARAGARARGAPGVRTLATGARARAQPARAWQPAIPRHARLLRGDRRLCPPQGREAAGAPQVHPAGRAPDRALAGLSVARGAGDTPDLGAPQPGLGGSLLGRRSVQGVRAHRVPRVPGRLPRPAQECGAGGLLPLSRRPPPRRRVRGHRHRVRATPRRRHPWRGHPGGRVGGRNGRRRDPRRPPLCALPPGAPPRPAPPRCTACCHGLA